MPAIALHAGKYYCNLKALLFSPNVLHYLITLLLRLGYYILLYFSSPSLQSAPSGGVTFAVEFSPYRVSSVSAMTLVPAG
jgi:hypothetical protein